MGSFLRSISDTTRHVNHPQKVVFCISPPLLGGYGINRTLSIGCNKSIATCTFLPSGACVWIIWRWWITFPLLWCECHYLDMLNTSSLERIIPLKIDLTSSLTNEDYALVKEAKEPLDLVCACVVWASWLKRNLKVFRKWVHLDAIWNFVFIYLFIF